MKILTVIIVAGLVGGGAVGGLYVGQVDWDAYFSDSNHHIDYKTNSQGQIYSVIHTDPQQDPNKDDGYYYAVTRYMIQNSQGILVIQKCNECRMENVDGIPRFTLNRNMNDHETVNVSVSIPGAYLVKAGESTCGIQMDSDFYVISEGHELELQHKERTLEECIESINETERFFNLISEWNLLYLVGGLEYWNDFDFWEDNIEEYGTFYSSDQSDLFRWDWMMRIGYFRLHIYDVKGVQTSTFNPGYHFGVLEARDGFHRVGTVAHYSVMRYQAFNMDRDSSLILIDDGKFESREMGDGYLFSMDKGVLYVPHATYVVTEAGNYYLLSETNTLDTLIMTDSKDELRPMMKCGQKFIEDTEGRQLKFVAKGEEPDLTVDYDFHVIRGGGENGSKNETFNPDTFDWTTIINKYYGMCFQDYSDRVDWSHHTPNYYQKGDSMVNVLASTIDNKGDGCITLIKFQRQDPGDCRLILHNTDGLQSVIFTNGAVPGYLFTYNGAKTFIPRATYVSEGDYFVLSTGYVLEYPVIGTSYGMSEYMARQAIQFFDSVPGTMLEFVPN